MLSNDTTKFLDSGNKEKTNKFSIDINKNEEDVKQNRNDINNNRDTIIKILKDDFYQDGNIRKDIISVEIIILILFLFLPILFYITGNLEIM